MGASSSFIRSHRWYIVVVVVVGWWVVVVVVVVVVSGCFGDFSWSIVISWIML